MDASDHCYCPDCKTLFVDDWDYYKEDDKLILATDGQYKEYVEEYDIQYVKPYSKFKKTHKSNYCYDVKTYDGGTTYDHSFKKCKDIE